jgi:ribonuclease G
MRRELLIAAGPGEWRAALLEDGVAVELRIERGEGGEAGSLYLGRVLRLLPALGAALVDIGGARPAFLPQSEIVPRGRRLDEGERVVVQIRREAQGGKAARLTTAVALRGEIVELVAGRSGLIGLEALAPETRARLDQLTKAAPHPLPLPARGEREGPAGPQSTEPRSGGRDVGSAQREGEAPTRDALGLRLFELAPDGAVIEEATGLVRRWQEIGEDAKRLDPPARLNPPATFAAALLGALPRADRILVDDPAAIPDIRAAFPHAAAAHLPEAEWPIDLDALVDAALSPTLALSGGGALHIEAARAAVLIDVDSGTPETGSPAHTALAVDLAAAAAVARQIRLRNLSGGIVVDFVGLDDRGARERVRAALARALMADPARPQILGWTRLGHLEIVRPRRARPLAETLLETPPGGSLIKTAVTVAHEALRALRREERAQPGRRWRLIVAPDVVVALAGDAAGAVRALEQRFGQSIAIAADPSLDRRRFQIVRA